MIWGKTKCYVLRHHCLFEKLINTKLLLFSWYWMYYQSGNTPYSLSDIFGEYNAAIWSSSLLCAVFDLERERRTEGNSAEPYTCEYPGAMTFSIPEKRYQRERMQNNKLYLRRKAESKFSRDRFNTSFFPGRGNNKKWNAITQDEIKIKNGGGGGGEPRERDTSRECN